jgi:hypothetical protein
MLQTVHASEMSVYSEATQCYIPEGSNLQTEEYFILAECVQCYQMPDNLHLSKQTSVTLAPNILHLGFIQVFTAMTFHQIRKQI